MLSSNSAPKVNFTILSWQFSFEYIHALNVVELVLEGVPNYSCVYVPPTSPCLALYFTEWRLKWELLIPFCHANSVLAIFTHCFTFLDSVDGTIDWNQLKLFPTLNFPFASFINIIQIKWTTTPVSIINTQIVENGDVVEIENLLWNWDCNVIGELPSNKPST